MLRFLELHSFRSHSSLSLEFSEKTNVIIGNNGRGKTNILESILVVLSGKSYRAKDSDLVQYDKDFARIKITVNERKQEVSLQKNTVGKIDKTFIIQSKKQKRLSFEQTIPVVLFEPEFMQIVSRSPEMRRDYFDGILQRIIPKYQTEYNKYRRVVAQRNALLKLPTVSPDQLFIWDVRLSEIGGYIAAHRIRLIEKINESISTIYSQLADQDQTVSLGYITKNVTENYTESLLKNLQKNVEQDKLRGFTSFGPHRDDISFLINHNDADTTASRGEIRTLLLALKIFELQLVEEVRNKKPILLLDDVFSELDETRQEKLIEYFSEHQVIITTTNISPLMRGVSGKIIELD